MFRRFLKNERGNFAIATAIAIVPILGGLALAIDFSEMNKQRQETLNALDAAGIAAARRVVEGATEAQVIAYAKDFFEANLNSVKPSNTKLTIVLPNNNTGGGTLKMSADLKYDPYFFPAFTSLVNSNSGGSTQIEFSAKTEVRLKNTLEVALVLDNSGSMSYIGTGSGQKRIDLLKSAAKQLVDTLADQAGQMKQVSKPVQFGLVPFAASVNVGANNATATWMDTFGISPVHHENFNWASMGAANANKRVELSAGSYYKRGTGWGTQENNIVTRFTLYNDIKRQTGTVFVKTGTEYVCTATKNGKCTAGYYKDIGYDSPVYETYASWQGCVEARPFPYNNTDDAPTGSNGATLFVPMFAPDEPGNKWTPQSATDSTIKTFGSYNSWWDDLTTSTSTTVANQLARQKAMPKYFEPAPTGKIAAAVGDDGPNGSCTTKAITPLTDVTVAAGRTAIKAAIDAMAPLGATNVPEGLAWGWRVVSGGVPFTEGRPDIEKGNDKVVIVLTDGENTYYTPSSLGYSDPAGNKSIYSNFGYTGVGYNGTATTRLFMGTSAAINKTNYVNSNYTNAMNEQFQILCANAKAKNVILMTVALDLDAKNTAEKAQIDAMTKCSSDSRFRRQADGSPEKLFWNAKGSDLAKSFKEIADELSNLRIVG
ncbi:MAG: pilus assembly protein TadG-related protein [Mesorhizobium sp.]|nr:pilus assembly protein TadG-related protein [Mesorhizobium sp.]